MRSSKPLLLVDIDNVLACTDEVMRRIIAEETGVEFDYEHITTFNYHECENDDGESIDETQWKLVHNIFSTPKHIREIAPMPGAVEALTRLGDACDIYIVTSRKEVAQPATHEWLREHGFDMAAHVGFTGHREKHVEYGRADLVIEDDLGQAEEFVAIGVDSILIPHPWNRGVGSDHQPRISRRAVDAADAWPLVAEDVLARI